MVTCGFDQSVLNEWDYHFYELKLSRSDECCSSLLFRMTSHWSITVICVGNMLTCSGTRGPCPVSYWFLHETYELGWSIDELHRDGVATNVLLMIARTGGMLAFVGKSCLSASSKEFHFLWAAADNPTRACVFWLLGWNFDQTIKEVLCPQSLAASAPGSSHVFSSRKPLKVPWHFLVDRRY